MTEQEIITRVWLHLNAQGAPSVNSDGGCLYRGPNGTSCAVGCLLDDETANRLDVNATIPSEYEWRSIAPEWTFPNVELLEKLQFAHDRNTDDEDVFWLAEWRDRMRKIAAEYNVTLSEVTQ